MNRERNEIRKTAICQRAILSGVLDTLEKRKEHINKKLQSAISKQEQAERTHDLLLNWRKEQVAECSGKLQGVYDAIDIVHGMWADLMWVTNWKN